MVDFGRRLPHNRRSCSYREGMSMRIVYVAPCAVEYVKKSTPGFIPVSLYDPMTPAREGEIGRTMTDIYAVLAPGIYEFGYGFNEYGQSDQLEPFKVGEWN